MRPRARTYEQEMAQAVYIEEARDVVAYIHCFYPNTCPSMSELAQRYFGLDPRNGWHSWLITLRHTPILWTDKEVPGITRLEPPIETSGT